LYCIFGEAESDFETLKELVRRLANDPRLKIKGKGFANCGELLKKGSKQIQFYRQEGFTRFIICYDADRENPEKRFYEVLEKIVNPAGVDGTFCVLIPIQEIETWILADIQAVTKVFPGWVPVKDIPNPESIQDPKEHLIKLSRNKNMRPRYIHDIHNQKVAQYIDLEMVERKCPSFLPLKTLIKTGVGNV
jgi:hypothetical protein